MKKLVTTLILISLFLIASLIIMPRFASNNTLAGPRNAGHTGSESNPNTHESCFPSGTQITMASRNTKNIEDVAVGDQVMSQNTDGSRSISTVQATESPVSNNMCQIRYTDGESLKVTKGHPLYTEAGWKAIDPKAAAQENPGVPVTKLLVGDLMENVDRIWPQVSSIFCQNETVQTYNLSVDNAHTFFAGGFLAHNKTVGNEYQITNENGGIAGNLTRLANGDLVSWTCFPAGTKILMSDGQQKNIEDVAVGDKVISQSETGKKSVSAVTTLDTPIRDNMCQINFEGGGKINLTNEHPLLTTTGWKAIIPNKLAYQEPNLVVGTFVKGDKIIKSDGSVGTIKSIACRSETVQTYNLILDGNAHTYFADGYLAHNKGSGGDSAPAPPACPTITPTNPVVTNISETQATLTWTPTAGGISQEIYAGTDSTTVTGGCPNGIGVGTGCSVAVAGLDPNLNTYTSGNVFSPGTVYHWLIVDVISSICTHISTATDLTSCDINPSTLTISPGETATLSTTLNPSPELSSVTYTPSGNFVNITPATDLTAPYSTQVTGVSVGSGTVISTVKDSTGADFCSTLADVTVIPPPPWWQIKDSDIGTNSDIRSQVSLGNFFGIPGPGGFPGVPGYAGTASFGQGFVSQPGWVAQSAIANPKVYDYQYFYNQIPSDILTNDINVIPSARLNGTDLITGGVADANGYYWYKYDGSVSRLDLTLNTAVNLGSRKVILLVDSANFDIKAPISLTDGQGFFMAVVGKNSDNQKGNIFIDPTVTGGNPDLKGIYVADGGFDTGSASTELKIRGSAVAYGEFVLNRALDGVASATTPSELFEYAPDQIMLLPNAFNARKINWKEVAP